MRAFLLTTFLALSAISATATSYAVQGGFLTYDPSLGEQFWTPRMLQLNVGGGTPHQLYFAFTSANLAVTCTPMCAVGDTFSLNLTMSGFVNRYGGGLWSGSLDLTTQPQKLVSQSGTEIAYFLLTGSISGCFYPVQPCPFTIAPNLHSWLVVNYQLVNGKMQINDISYAIPEPSTIVLFGTGVCVICFLSRKRSPSFSLRA